MADPCPCPTENWRKTPSLSPGTVTAPDCPPGVTPITPGGATGSGFFAHLVDAYGTVVYDPGAGSSSGIVTVSSFDPGVYVLHLTATGTNGVGYNNSVTFTVAGGLVTAIDSPTAGPTGDPQANFLSVTGVGLATLSWDASTSTGTGIDAGSGYRVVVSAQDGAGYWNLQPLTYCDADDGAPTYNYPGCPLTIDGTVYATHLVPGLRVWVLRSKTASKLEFLPLHGRTGRFARLYERNPLFDPDDPSTQGFDFYWQAYSGGAFADDGALVDGYRAFALTVDSTNWANPVGGTLDGTRVWMIQSDTPDRYEFLPIGYADHDHPGLVSYDPESAVIDTPPAVPPVVEIGTRVPVVGQVLGDGNKAFAKGLQVNTDQFGGETGGLGTNPYSMFTVWAGSGELDDIENLAAHPLRNISVDSNGGAPQRVFFFRETYESWAGGVAPHDFIRGVNLYVGAPYKSYDVVECYNRLVVTAADPGGGGDPGTVTNRTTIDGEAGLYARGVVEETLSRQDEDDVSADEDVFLGSWVYLDATGLTSTPKHPGLVVRSAVVGPDDNVYAMLRARGNTIGGGGGLNPWYMAQGYATYLHDGISDTEVYAFDSTGAIRRRKFDNGILYANLAYDLISSADTAFRSVATNAILPIDGVSDGTILRFAGGEWSVLNPPAADVTDKRYHLILAVPASGTPTLDWEEVADVTVVTSVDFGLETTTTETVVAGV